MRLGARLLAAAAATALGSLAPPAAQAAETPAEPPPLLANLGHAVWPIETSSPLAQRYFNQGVRLLYGFNFEQAIDAFRAAETQDGSGCAICLWGESYAVGEYRAPPRPLALALPLPLPSSRCLARMLAVSDTRCAIYQGAT